MRPEIKARLQNDVRIKPVVLPYAFQTSKRLRP